ncbi:MAG: cyclodeaminase/cyclohydrolase family protein [Thermoplasmata archaeon]
MGLKTQKKLQSFCRELSSGKGSPGGGSASAAAGAIAASLLAMVCRVTRENRRHEEHWKELDSLSERALERMKVLLNLAKEDADACDAMVEAKRKIRVNNTQQAAEEFNMAVARAADVPMKTASACADVLEVSSGVAEIGTKSASSDIGVAILLAEAGFKGASMNVATNLRSLKDSRSSSRLRANLAREKKRARSSARKAFAAINETLST